MKIFNLIILSKNHYDSEIFNISKQEYDKYNEKLDWLREVYDKSLNTVQMKIDKIADTQILKNLITVLENPDKVKGDDYLKYLDAYFKIKNEQYEIVKQGYKVNG